MNSPLAELGRKHFGTRAEWGNQWKAILRWVTLKWAKHQSVDSVLFELVQLANGTSCYVAVDTGRCCLEIIDPLLVVPLQDSELEELGWPRTPPPRTKSLNRTQTKVLPVHSAFHFFTHGSWELLALHVLSAIEILSGRPDACSDGLVSAPVASRRARYWHELSRGGELCRFLLRVLQSHGSACHACHRYKTRANRAKDGGIGRTASEARASATRLS